MKTTTAIKFIWVLGLLFGLSLNNQLLAQEQYRLTGKPEIKVTGGSTIHDWEMASTQSLGKAEMIVEGSSLQDVKSAKVVMKAESLKSGKDKMDDIAYESLKTKKHADITFTLTSFKNLDGNKALATGNLTIAGTTKPVTFTVEKNVKSGSVYLSGNTAIKFTDFNLTPPTALLGTIKTSNDLKLHFKVNFQPNAI